MSLDAQYFADLYADSDDPWAFRTRWYERRKRDLLLASLPRQRYERVFEPACANGELSVLLAERCASLLCQDIDSTAVGLARQRLGTAHHAHVEQGHLPGDWPGGQFDLIVLGEIGYYLDPTAWLQVIEQSVASLTADGALLACHWRHPIAGLPAGWPRGSCPAGKAPAAVSAVASRRGGLSARVLDVRAQRGRPE